MKRLYSPSLYMSLACRFRCSGGIRNHLFLCYDEYFHILHCEEAKGPTIDKLIYNHKIILHRFLIYLAKIWFTDIDKTITELEDKGCIRVRPVHSSVSQSPIGCQPITHLVTATTYRLLILTWKKLVDPRVTIGDLTSLLDTTWILNTSEMDRLVWSKEGDK